MIRFSAPITILVSTPILMRNSNKDPYFHATWILSTGSSNRKSKIVPGTSLFIDVSDTVKVIGVEIDSTSLTLNIHHHIFVTVTVSVIVPS